MFRFLLLLNISTVLKMKYRTITIDLFRINIKMKTPNNITFAIIHPA